MQSIKEVLEAPISPYTGSQSTYDMVKAEIASRWGDEEADKYDPYTNCLTFRNWLARGSRVKRGEKSIRSVTFVEKEDEHGKVVAKYPKTVCLFYYLQVEKIKEV